MKAYNRLAMLLHAHNFDYNNLKILDVGGNPTMTRYHPLAAKIHHIQPTLTSADFGRTYDPGRGCRCTFGVNGCADCDDGNALIMIHSLYCFPVTIQIRYRLVSQSHEVNLCFR